MDVCMVKKQRNYYHKLAQLKQNIHRRKNNMLFNFSYGERSAAK